MSTKRSSSTPAKRTSATKAAKASPVTPKKKRRASAAVAASYESVGKSKGGALPPLTETDHADLAETPAE